MSEPINVAAAVVMASAETDAGPRLSERQHQDTPEAWALLAAWHREAGIGADTAFRDRPAGLQSRASLRGADPSSASSEMDIVPEADRKAVGERERVEASEPGRIVWASVRI